MSTKDATLIIRGKCPTENFGGNVALAPRCCYSPATEDELLAILRSHRDSKFRAIGRLHSWSDVIRADDVLIDLRQFDSVVIHDDGQHAWAEVGAGCQIKRLLDVLRRDGYTTLSQGLIKEQAVAGAAATATHGSGKHCLSNYVDSVRIARFRQPDDEPVIDEISDGPELAAARCSLGCLGIVTRLRIPIRKTYFVEEQFRYYARLNDVLAAEEAFDLQQFYVVPWRWDYHAQHRREASGPRSLLAPLYRLYWNLGVDVGLHLAIITLARWLPRLCTRLFFRWILLALVPKKWKVVDRSDLQLSMGHELFRHIETELFVTRSELPAALDFVALTLRHAAGERVELDPATRSALLNAGLMDQWEQAANCYMHHYPICVRKILADKTLLAMSNGGDQAWYSISLISYAKPESRDGFFRVSCLLASAMGRLFKARPHWGKYCPLTRADVDRLYPSAEEFRAIRQRSDPQERFLNAWLTELFGVHSP